MTMKINWRGRTLRVSKIWGLGMMMMRVLKGVKMKLLRDTLAW